MRLPYNLGKYGTWSLLVLAAIGGIGNIAHLLTPTKTKVEFVNPDVAKALAIRAATVDVTIWPGESKQEREKAFQEFGWQVDSFDSNGTTVSVNQATALAPNVLSSTQEVVPVLLWETVKPKNDDAYSRKQIAHVFIQADEKGNVTVGGAPWIEEVTQDTKANMPTSDMDPTTIRPVIEQFLTTWWSGGDISNQVANKVQLPKLPFQSNQVKIQQFFPIKYGKTGAEVVVNFSVVDPKTNVSMPMQIVFVLDQPVKDHWMIQQVFPY